MRGTKRYLEDDGTMNKDFIKRCRNEFKKNPLNILAKNAVTTIGSEFASTNQDEVNKVSHVFKFTTKKKDVKATDQGNSGRCWMFAGLNVYRHKLMKAFDIGDFEFSQTYLFFWDKFERANKFLVDMIDNIDIPLNDRKMEYILSDCMTDGGFWNMFSNLVNKYGVVPQSCMKETFQSAWSSDMNDVLRNMVMSCATYIRNNKQLSDKQMHNIRLKQMEQVYNTLVKYLGNPPTKFNWEVYKDSTFDLLKMVSKKSKKEESDSDSESESEFESDDDIGVFKRTAIMIPFNKGAEQFKDLIQPSPNDFVVLSHIPTHDMKMYERYEIKYSNNVIGGENCTFVNVSIEDLKKYTMLSIFGGIPVWFGCDVSKGFNYFNSTLDEKINDNDLLFGKVYKTSKGEKLSTGNLTACHAMVITGVNVDTMKRPINWQVENSWGYWSSSVPGLDGFLTMSDEWFTNNVIEVVIYKELLMKDRNISPILDKVPIQKEPWNLTGQTMKITSVKVPEIYRNKEKYRAMMEHKRFIV